MASLSYARRGFLDFTQSVGLPGSDLQVKYLYSCFNLQIMTEILHIQLTAFFFFYYKGDVIVWMGCILLIQMCKKLKIDFTAIVIY